MSIFNVTICYLQCLRYLFIFAITNINFSDNKLIEQNCSKLISEKRGAE